VIIEIQEQPHPHFKREKDDLIMEQQITLLEALTGYQFLIHHLDNRILLVKSEPNEIIRPGTFHFLSSAVQTVNQTLPTHHKKNFNENK
jgi:DnaJ family protein A protein 2